MDYNVGVYIRIKNMSVINEAVRGCAGIIVEVDDKLTKIKMLEGDRQGSIMQCNNLAVKDCLVIEMRIKNKGRE